MTTKEKVLMRTDANLTHDEADFSTCKCTSVETADGYEIYAIQYSTKWSMSLNPDELYYYEENFRTEIQDAIRNGESVYLSEYLAEDHNLQIDEEDSDFWAEIWSDLFPEVCTDARELMELINEEHEWEDLEIPLDEFLLKHEDDLSEDEIEQIKHLLELLGNNYFN